MTFAWPHLLWVLILPAALLWWELTHRRRLASATRPKILRAEAGPRSLRLSSSAAPPTAPGTQPRVWLCVGLALAVLALARPQWGRLEEPVFDQSREILLAIDLSRSMLAEDVKPSRLERAKLLIQSLLEKLAGERVGLVVFSGTSFLQSPLSADYEILREFLPALSPDYLPEGGSNYGALLETALQAFGASSSADRFLVVLSDGEATDEDWRARIADLKTKAVRVIGLGVGTVGGAMIPDGGGGLVKDDRGAVVLSKLEPATLEELARATNGVYRDASAWVDLAGLVNQTIETGRKGDFLEKRTVRLAERFQWPLALAVWCLLVSFYYEFPVRPKPRDVKLGEHTGNRPPETGKLTTTAAALLLVLSGFKYPVSGFAAARLDPKSDSAATVAPEPPALAKIVGRLAGAPHPSARDWAELGRETVNWGSKLKSEQQPVPEGPVRDALTAVNLGTKLDAKVTDWPKLREELEALLEKPEEEKDKDDKQQQDQKDKQDQQKDQKKSDQKSDEKNDDPTGNQQKSGPQDQKDQQQQQNQSPQQPSPEQKPGESAFGDMNKKDGPPPPPPQPNTQKVGGAPEKKDEPKEPVDPALALPLQKLEQLRNQDSPAHLFQLMEPDKKPTKKTGKDW